MKYVAAILLTLIVVSPARAGWLWGPRVVIHNYGTSQSYIGTSSIVVSVVPRVHKERHVYKPRGEKHVVKVKY